MPLTASSPIEPPGNRIGRTTKASVVSASRAPPTVQQRRVAEPLQLGSRRVLGQQRHDQPSTSARLALPPAPCAVVIALVDEPRPAPAHRLDALADLDLGDASSPQSAGSACLHQDTSRCSRCLAYWPKL